MEKPFRGQVALQRLATIGDSGKQGRVLSLIPHSVFNRQACLTNARRAVDRESAPRVLLEALMQVSQDLLAALEQAAYGGIGQVPRLRLARPQLETIAKYQGTQLVEHTELVSILSAWQHLLHEFQLQLRRVVRLRDRVHRQEFR